MLFHSGRALLLTCLLIAMWTVFGMSYFYRDPGSIFFNAAYAYEKHYSRQRMAAASDLLQRAQSQSPLHFTRAFAASQIGVEAPHVEICLGVPTVKRDALEEQYVSITVASILEGSTYWERAVLDLSVYFADENYTSHPDWNAAWLSALTDDVWTNNNETAQSSTHAYLQEIGLQDLHTSSKATVDYSLVLEKCLTNTKAPLVAVFEGDTVLARGWIAPTLLALREAGRLLKSERGDDADWLFTRLFTQERSSGWGDKRIGHNHEIEIVVFINMIASLTFVLLRRRATSFLHKHMDYGTLGVILLVTVPALVVMFYQTGKASLLPPRDGLQIDNIGCCSQAWIFNRRQVPALIQHLREEVRKEIRTSSHTNYDLVIARYARQERLSMLSLYPVQAQHLGLKSSVGANETESQAVWSMAFESLNSDMLARRHRAAVKALFGSVED